MSGFTTLEQYLHSTTLNEAKLWHTTLLFLEMQKHIVAMVRKVLVLVHKPHLKKTYN